MKQLIECVPNFSEGRDPEVIRKITDRIESVKGVRLLDVDMGYATHRTVVTFVGEPEAVLEAAFRAMQEAQLLIDMSVHKGEHPRFGATDVCPLIPLSNISMEEVAKLAHQLAKRVGDELDYPVYCYESAAKVPERKNLAFVRAGEYEGLAQKVKEHTPDFGPVAFKPRTGATAIGARDFLIAVNFNLNTTSTRLANAVAFDVREAGRVLREGNPLTGKIINDENGEPKRIPGTCKGTKAIGWYIDEYGIAQVSMNITDINATPLHIAFEEIVKSATSRGLRVTGTEIVGLVPLRVLREAGRYFLHKQKRSSGIAEDELLKIAVKSMGLDDLKPFDSKKNVIEYLIADTAGQPLLVKQTLETFADTTASEAPAPGGGSVAAYVGALGAALGTMVANLSAHKRGWEEHWEAFSRDAETGQALTRRLCSLVDEDTQAFNGIMEAFKLPKNTPEETQARKNAIQEATKNAIEVPFSVMQACLETYPLLLRMAKDGNPNSASDAGVGALCTTAALKGALLNVKINAGSYTDKGFVNSILLDAEKMLLDAQHAEAAILAEVNKHL